MIHEVSGNRPATLADSSSVIVAFSGGADSVLAAHAAAATGKPVILWYMHHYNTPVEPARKKVFSRLRSKLRIAKIAAERRDVTKIAARLGYSWEHAASLLRRKLLTRFLGQLAAAGEIPVVVTGHNYSDYLETLWLRRDRRLPRDAWPKLSQQDEITGFFRPLWQMTRDEVRARVKELGLPYFDDPANDNEKFARNRIRNAPPPPPPPSPPQVWGGEEKVACPPELGATGRSLLPEVGRGRLRELHLPLETWKNLSRVQKARTLFFAFRRLAIVRKFTRNHFTRAHRLPFNLPPFFAHEEKSGRSAVVVFRRGLGASVSLPAAAGGTIRGDAVSRRTRIVMPYGRKSVANIFSEKKLSPRERRRTLVFMAADGVTATRILFPQTA